MTLTKEETLVRSMITFNVRLRYLKNMNSFSREISSRPTRSLGAVLTDMETYLNEFSAIMKAVLIEAIKD